MLPVEFRTSSFIVIYSCSFCTAKIDGHWGNWSPYGPCSEQCNEGVRKRERTCNDPPAENGGKRCPGLYMESILCVNPSCPTSIG